MSAASNLSIVDSEALQTPKKSRTSGVFASAKSAAFHKTLFFVERFHHQDIRSLSVDRDSVIKMAHLLDATTTSIITKDETIDMYAKFIFPMNSTLMRNFRI
ncbi:unnamed protein product [Pylaiella littoralis]